MKNSIGVDAGGSLIKIAYEEKGRLHFRKYPFDELESALGWMRMFCENKKLFLTGGKAGKIKAEFFPNAEMVDEFTAACVGAKHLMVKESMPMGEKFLLVIIGTGTSWFTIDGDQYERVLGSGIGGGTFMGLGNMFAELKDFSKLVKLSSTGERGRVDLLVKDIYFPEEPPIHGDLTASNFAKSGIEESSPADRMAAVTNMISETITLLTVQASTLQNIQKVVFIGSTLSGNKPLQNSIDYYIKMSGLDPVFLPDGEYSGAIGAMGDI